MSPDRFDRRRVSLAGIAVLLACSIALFGVQPDP